MEQIIIIVSCRNLLNSIALESEIIICDSSIFSMFGKQVVNPVELSSEEVIVSQSERVAHYSGNDAHTIIPILVLCSGIERGRTAQRTQSIEQTLKYTLNACKN